MALTSYGTMAQFLNTDTVMTLVTESLEGDTTGFDVEAIVDDVRTMINEVLPGGITLVGGEFFGPYPKPEGYFESIAEALDEIDPNHFWDIVRTHDSGVAKEVRLRLHAKEAESLLLQ